MKRSEPKPITESERDRWMSRRAWSHIADQPGLFLRACGHRFLWFWNVFPPQTALDAMENSWRQGCDRIGFISWKPAAGLFAQTVAGGVILFYAVLFASFAVGVFRLKRQEWTLWWPLALLVACFCFVHLFYWTDARMRAPVMPAVVLVAVRAWFPPAVQTEGKA
jgi:hypothetical protein